MDPTISDRYRQARDEAAAKAADMPSWMLRRCVNHAIRLAYSERYKATAAMQETAWGSADGFADEILRRGNAAAIWG